MTHHRHPEDDMARAHGSLVEDATGDRVAEQVLRYRRSRETIERGTLALATSVDGRTFELQASLHDLRLLRGAHVVLEGEGPPRLGQVTDLAMRSVPAEVADGPGSRTTVLVRAAVGSGLLVDRGAPFHDARVRPAEPHEVADWVARVSGPARDRARLDVGELLHSPGVTAELDSGGFNRHTFLCGQSGSGKTYSLGLVLERLLTETSLDMVVLDPNSDHVGLGRTRAGAEGSHARRHREVAGGVSVWGGEGADHLLRLRFDELDSRTRTAALGLDPLRDAEEYAALTGLLAAREEGRPLVTGLADLLESSSPATRRLGVRAGNLGVLDWSLWSQEEPSLLQELAAPTARCVVVDLGSLETPDEQRVVADAVLAALWARRTSRRPVLVVVDEAHNVCAADPTDPLSRVTTERAVQIAAEGRKYGLYLLASTQRPGKVHENVVSQCDNLLLMRMNSASDLLHLERLFSFVPPGLMAGATTFGLGQVLVAGRILPSGAGYVQMGARVSQEGGADVPLTWARPRRP